MNTGRSFSWRSNAGATWPRWSALWPLELIIAFVIIVSAMCALAMQVPTLLFKVHVAEVFMATFPQRMAIVEHYANTGRLLESDAALQRTAVSTTSLQVDYETHLSARAFGITPASPGAKSEQGLAWLRTGLADGSVRAIGFNVGFERPFELAMRAAVDPGESVATVSWVCGKSSVPGGRTAPAVIRPTNLPAALLPSLCRGEKE